ncbi:hypothetical protein WCE41_05685 [Luteimonas sp. MJ246]|uniref:hypothetical protein n=1 Tax=Luteimonas sp. MJ174 TaxID=3129237 RepID=UPI0031BA40B6
MPTEPAPAVDAALLHALLAELAAHPGGLSTARLCKRLGLRMSLLLRALAWMGEGSIGGVPGPGWVATRRDGARVMVVLTGTGRRLLDSLAP